MGISHIACPGATEEVWFVKVITTAHNSDDEWVRAETLVDPNTGNRHNALMDCVITEKMNVPRKAELIIANRAKDPYSLDADCRYHENGDEDEECQRFGPLTNEFKEGTEVLILNHTTHVISFRGYVYDKEINFNEMTGSTIELTCYDSLMELQDQPLEGLLGYDRYGQLETGSRSIAEGLGSVQIKSLIDDKLRDLSTSSGNERFVHFDFSDVSAATGNNNQHHFSLSYQDNSEKINLGGGWLTGARASLAKKILEVATADPLSTSTTAKSGFNFSIAPNILDPGDRVDIGRNMTWQSPSDQGETVVGKWIAYNKVQKMLTNASTASSQQTYRKPAFAYFETGEWPNTNPTNYGVRILRPAQEAVQNQSRLDLHDGSNTLYPQKVMQPDASWERASADIFTSAVVNYSIEGEMPEDDDEGGAAQQSSTFEMIHVWNLTKDGTRDKDFWWKDADGEPLAIGNEGLTFSKYDQNGVLDNAKDAPSRGNDNGTGTPNCAEHFFIDTRNADSGGWTLGTTHAGAIQFTSIAATTNGTGPNTGSPTRSNIHTMIISHINRGFAWVDSNADGILDAEQTYKVWPSRNAQINVGPSVASTATFVRLRGAYSGATAYFDAGGGGSDPENDVIWRGRAIDFVGKASVARINIGSTSTMQIRKSVAFHLARMSKDTRRGTIRIMGANHYELDMRVDSASYQSGTRQVTLTPKNMNATWGSAAVMTPLYNLGVRIGDPIVFYGAGSENETTAVSNFHVGKQLDYGYLASIDSGSAIKVNTTRPQSAGQLDGAITSTSATTITLDSGHNIITGDRIIVGSEFMKVTAHYTTTLEVVRGFDSSTAATHSDNASVTIKNIANQDYMRVYVPIRAGMSVRLQDYMNNISGNYLVEEVTYRNYPGTQETILTVYGEQDDVEIEVTSPGERNALMQLAQHSMTDPAHTGYHSMPSDARGTKASFTGNIEAG